jgi:hypothetical protein
MIWPGHRNDAAIHAAHGGGAPDPMRRFDFLCWQMALVIVFIVFFILRNPGPTVPK